MVKKPNKVFKPLPAIDLNYRKGNIKYFPSVWPKRSTFRKSKANRKNLVTCVRVNRLHRKTTRRDLHEKFSAYGPIAAISPIKIVNNRNSSRKREGYAYITYHLEEDAEFALKPRARFLKGEAIFVHRELQERKNINYNIEPAIRIYSMETMLTINDKYRELFSERDDGSSTKLYYFWIFAIDQNIPHQIKLTTICDTSSEDNESESTCPRSWGDLEPNSDTEYNSSLELEDFEQNSTTSTSSESILNARRCRRHQIMETEWTSSNSGTINENEWDSRSELISDSKCEFNPEDFHELDDHKVENFVCSDPLYVDENQMNFQGSVYLDYDEFGNCIVNYGECNDNNQIINYPLPQHNEIYHSDDPYNQYFISEEYTNTQCNEIYQSYDYYVTNKQYSNSVENFNLQNYEINLDEECYNIYNQYSVPRNNEIYQSDEHYVVNKQYCNSVEDCNPQYYEINLYEEYYVTYNQHTDPQNTEIYQSEEQYVTNNKYSISEEHSKLQYYEIYHDEEYYDTYNQYYIPQNYEIYHSDEYYINNHQFFIPEQYYDCDPICVDPSIDPDALRPIINLNGCETENNQLYEFKPIVYAPLHEYSMNNSQIVDLTDCNQLEEINMFIPLQNTVNDDTFEVLPHLIPCQNYLESFIETVRLYEHDPSYSLQCNPNETIHGRNIINTTLAIDVDELNIQNMEIPPFCSPETENEKSI